MFDITSALNFVDRHGDFLNKEAIKKFQNRPFDMFGVAFYLLYDQNDDGGFPIFRIQNAPSSIFETCSRLSVLIDFELTKGLAVKNAVNFLLRKQKEEGFWEEPENLPEEVPDWLRPGKTETRIFETVNVLDVLLSLNSIPQEKLKLGLAFLRKNLQDNNLLKGFIHSSFILVSILCKINDDENALKVFYSLTNKLLELDIDTLIWAINCFIKCQFLRESTIIKQWIEKISSMQQNDGGLPGENMKQRANLTMDFLFLLKNWGNLKFYRKKIIMD